jgi:metal-sulfur cluster biosynthetic enzyme
MRAMDQKNQAISEGAPAPESRAGGATEEAAVPGNGSANGLEEQIMEALRQVDDPELGINIVDLGLVYEVAIVDETVHIEYTLTTMGCPIGPMIEAQIKQLIEPIEGVTEVDAEMVLTPPWTPEKMSEEAKAALGMF